MHTSVPAEWAWGGHKSKSTPKLYRAVWPTRKTHPRAAHKSKGRPGRLYRAVWPNGEKRRVKRQWAWGEHKSKSMPKLYCAVWSPPKFPCHQRNMPSHDLQTVLLISTPPCRCGTCPVLDGGCSPERPVSWWRHDLGYAGELNGEHVRVRGPHPGEVIW